MNTLSGRIHSVESSLETSLVRIDVKGDVFYAVILETPDTLSFLKAGSPVKLLFKETEVILNTHSLKGSSLLNEGQGRLTEIRRGKILSEVFFSYHDAAISAIVPTLSLNTMALEKGQAVRWSVKVNEITIQWNK